MAALALALLGLVALVVLPDGGLLRLLFVLPVMFFAPGYLFIQTIMVPARPVLARWQHAALSIGVSPAIVGLLALATAIVPRGFTMMSILVVVFAFTFVAGGVAVARRVLERGAQPAARGDAPGRAVAGTRRAA